MVEEKVALVLTDPLIFQLVSLHLYLHFVFEGFLELSLDFSNGYFIESQHGQAFGFAVDVFQLVLIHGSIARKLLHKVLLEGRVTFLNGLLALILADVAP